jgi:hypothetical protein
VASVADCEQALHRLAARMAESGANSGPNRSLTCTLRDLEVTFAGQLDSGRLNDIHRADDANRGQIGLTMTSDDLLAMVDGGLNVASAWASGRIKIDASPMDLLRLRSIF